MSFWSRLTNTVRRSRMDESIREEIQSHIEEAVSAGRDRSEARRAFGSMLKCHEQSRDIRLISWLEALLSDIVFGWRQLRKNKVASTAAILSLALAMGACIATFRLIDAVLLRPLPVEKAERLYDLNRHGIGPEGKEVSFDGWAYPAFQLMRAAVKGQAELIAVGFADRVDIEYGKGGDVENAYRQYVSGWMFDAFGLRPAIGRLFHESDDVQPASHPYAVLSQNYWEHRFGANPAVIGQTFQMAGNVYEIIGVVDGPFVGTEPGTITDIFVPTMMHPFVTRDDATWFRTLAQIPPEVPVEPVRAKLAATSLAFEENRAKGFTGMPPASIRRSLDYRLLLDSAGSGVSGLQKDYGQPLAVLAVLVVLVLLIASANVANLMSAQAAVRSREMAMRVSIGAGRWRLRQMMLVESAMIATAASISGSLLAWWSAPFVVARINPPDNPARLILPADWRVLGFGVLLSFMVTVMFGLPAAMRASQVQPAGALKGGENPFARQRLMRSLIAVQVTVCFLVLFVAGLMTATFARLSRDSTGFSSDRLLALDVVTRPSQSSIEWLALADRLKQTRGVEGVAVAGWPLLRGGSSNSYISLQGSPVGPNLTYFLNVSSDWLSTMKIHLVSGRDFVPNEPDPQVAIVTEQFAKTYLNGEDPVGKWFIRTARDVRYQIVGMVNDVRYRDLREPLLPVAFIPFSSLTGVGTSPYGTGDASLLVRSSAADPLSMASTLRDAVHQNGMGFRVSNARSQKEINQSHTIRERLLATLGTFFAAVALLLSGLGLYGVLHYSVVQRRREIGIRIALGAPARNVAWRVAQQTLLMVLTGISIGMLAGLTFGHLLQSLLYQVRITDAGIIAVPLGAIVAVVLLATLPAVIDAVRVDPAITLRAE